MSFHRELGTSHENAVERNRPQNHCRHACFSCGDCDEKVCFWAVRVGCILGVFVLFQKNGVRDSNKENCLS